MQSTLDTELSVAFPPDVVVCSHPMIAQWKHRKQLGEQWGCDRCLRVRLWARWCLNVCPPHFSAPSLSSSNRPVKSRSTANVSECSVIQGRLAAVDKYWKCYPSLKHHSFTYCKCASLRAPSPRCWQGGRQHQAAPAMTEHHQMQPQTELSLLKLQRTDCVSELGSRL